MPDIAILLCTYNGAEFLPAQLTSISNQTVQDYEIWASDDGSTDGTLDILRDYAGRFDPARLTLQQGPHKGVAANFLSLATNPHIKAAYYAYCDQDDLWHATKLERAIAQLRNVPIDIPALYCSRTGLIDRDGRLIGYSAVCSKPFSFENALVQNVAAGNTMVFNHAAKQLMLTQGLLDVGMHDWWTYLVVTGCGGRIYYDPEPLVQYRQHGSNVLGSNLSLAARWTRIRMLWDGKFREWNEKNVRALDAIRDSLTPHNRQTLEVFRRAREQNLPFRLFQLFRSGVYRQTALGNAGLVMAALLNRI